MSVEETETDDHLLKDDRPVVTQDRPAKPRPRFDPSREYASAQRVMDKRKVVQPPREHGRDPGTDGPPDTEAEVKQRRRYPPPPPPASSMRQPQTSHRSLAFANPPPRRDSATESSRVSERQPSRFRSQETPPQRPMPKRVVATSTVGSSAPPRLQDTSGRAPRGDYYDQSRVRDDRTYGSQHQQERQEWGSSQRRVPSMGRRESLHAWAGHQHSGHQYQDWSQQQPSTQEYWNDPQQGHPQHYPQQPAATQHWHAQQMQQQLPALPNPVYPPGMQPSVQPPPGLGSNVQRTMSPREHGQQQQVNAVQDRPQAFAPRPADVVAENQRQENREYHDGRNIFVQQRNILQQVIQQFQQPPQLEMILENQRDVMHQLVQEAHRVRQEVKDIKNAMVHALQTVDTNHASHDQIIQAQAQYLQRLTAKQDALTNAMQALSEANVRLNESMLAQERI